MGFREHAEGILWIIVIVSLYGYITGAAARATVDALAEVSLYSLVNLVGLMWIGVELAREA